MQRNGSIWYTHDECLFLNGMVTVRHWPDQTKPRSSYMPLLELRCQENPKDDMSYVYLLREKVIYHKFLEIAGKNSRIREEIKDFGGEQKAAALVYLGDSLCEISDIQSAIPCYRDAIQANPTVRAPYIRMARRLCDQRRFKEAKDILFDCLKNSKRNTFWNWVDSESMWTWEVYDWLCVASYGLEEYDEADMWAEKALEAAPDNKHIQTNLRLCKEKIQNGR